MEAHGIRTVRIKRLARQWQTESEGYAVPREHWDSLRAPRVNRGDIPDDICPRTWASVVRIRKSGGYAGSGTGSDATTIGPLKRRRRTGPAVVNRMRTGEAPSGVSRGTVTRPPWRACSKKLGVRLMPTCSGLFSLTASTPPPGPNALGVRERAPPLLKRAIGLGPLHSLVSGDPRSEHLQGMTGAVGSDNAELFVEVA